MRFSGAHTTRQRRSTNILVAVIRGVLRRPWRVMVVDDQRSWRGFHLLLGALFVASAVARKSSNRRIGIMLPTSGMFPVATLATWLLGRTAVPLNYLLNAEELRYVITDAKLDLVITVRPMIERFGALPEGVGPLFLEDISRRGIPRPRWPRRFNRGTIAVLIYTSGTSGRPKGVELSSAAMAANVSQCAEWGKVTHRDVFLGVLPQFHCFGLTVLTLLPLSVGGKVVYTARFVPGRLFELMRSHRPTGFVAIPAMYRAMMADRRATAADFASFRYLISGGEPLPRDLQDAFRARFGTDINQGYGLTETGPVVNWCRPEDERPLSVGRALPDVEEQIVDGQGKVLPAGEEGEIIVRGPNLMRGYLGQPDATSKAIDSDGFFHTGDLGRFDSEGFLTITGRLSDLIIVAGENVFPAEIEAVLSSHDDVKEAAVVGAPDQARGQVPIAFIELEEGAEFDERGLRAYCRERLATYKVPRTVQVVDELPRTATGKVLRRTLLERHGAAAESADSEPTGQ